MVKVGILFIDEDRVRIEFLIETLESDSDFETVYVDLHALSPVSGVDVVVGVLSKKSLHHLHFLRHLELAVSNEVRVSPVLIDATIDFSAIPESINSIQWVEFWDELSRTDHLKRLVRALKTDFDHLELFRKYEELADTWFRRAERPDHLLRGQALDDSESWLRRSRSNFPRPTSLIIRFIESGRSQAEMIRLRNERILRIFWSLMTVGTIVCIVFAAFIFRDTLRIQDAEREAVLRKSQSQELIEYMVGELDEQLTQMGETELLAGIIDSAETYVDEMEQEALDADDLAFKVRLESLIEKARGHLREAENGENGELSK